jgi:ferrous iron transport protein B
LKITSFTVIFQKTGIYILWYLREIVPLILISAVALFVLDALTLLPLLRSVIAPVVTSLLSLPEKFTETVILGLVRKDFGAVSIYDLANNGYLNSIQILVATTFLSLSVPCIGFLGAIKRIQGSRFMVLLFLGSTLYAFLIAGLLNWILRI